MHDTLADYLEKRERYLSAEEERALAVRIQSGDIQARDTLVLANVRLAMKIAKRYKDKGLDEDDLFSEAFIGLLHAVDVFDPERGRFTTVATWYVRQAILKAFYNQARLIRLPQYLYTPLRQMRKCLAALPHASAAEIAQKTGIDLATVNELLPYTLHTLSLSLTVDSEHENTLADILVDECVEAEFNEIDAGGTQEDATQEVVGMIMCTLNPREREVIRLYYGLDDNGPRTLADVGRQLGLTRERARQIHVAAIKKMQNSDVAARFVADKRAS